jgi:hypothetical protein
VAKVITFPEAEPFYDFDNDCLAFHANVEGKTIECIVTLELLMASFRATDPSEETMRQSYREYKEEIQAIARTHIDNGWIDNEDRVFLTTRYTRLKVTFDESPKAREFVAFAHRILLDIIGPNAEEVIIEWQGDEDPPGSPSISVRIVDPDTTHSVKAFFGSKESADTNTLSFNLARLWSSILRERSRKLNLRMG